MHRAGAGIVDIVTTNDYHMTMISMTAGVAEFKARLSEYLRAVQRGRHITIQDRDRPIAQVVPYGEPGGRIAVRVPVRTYRTLGDIKFPPPVKLSIDPVALLLQERRRDR
jgi:prevent-host-death family protein